MTSVNGAGPLSGLRVLEFSGLGPAPFASMYLADLGAEVVSLKRAGSFQMPGDPRKDSLERGKKALSADLKAPEGIALARALAQKADVVIEGYRPGAMERLGLGPDELLQLNPRLVYGRMTGWGQTGPLSQRAGHDPNYIGLVGALHAIGRKGEAPVMPLSLVGDFGGGAMYLVAGILAALWESSRSGKGQVVDAAIVDGAAHLMAPVYGFLAAGSWVDDRGSNLLDSGTPFIDTYETADGKYMAAVAMEEPFYREFVRVLGIADRMPAKRFDPSTFDEQRRIIAEAFLSRTRDEWVEAFDGLDACVGPVLSLTEAPRHPHNVARGTFFDRDGHPEPSPAPRFSRTVPGVPARAEVPGDTPAAEILSAWGVSVP
jgi:alpha-methylacyl-CoA racemase